MQLNEKFRKKLNSLSGNSRIVLKNSVAAILIKGAGVIISVLSMPAFLRYFDDKAVLGVWYTILGVVTWIDFFDLGIGNGLRNSLVDSFNARHFRRGIAKGPKGEIQTRELYMGKCGWKSQLRIPFSGFTTFARVWHHAG